MEIRLDGLEWSVIRREESAVRRLGIWTIEMSSKRSQESRQGTKKVIKR